MDTEPLSTQSQDSNLLLEKTWESLVPEPSTQQNREYFQNLCKLYSQPQRAYHTRVHIQDLILKINLYFKQPRQNSSSSKLNKIEMDIFDQNQQNVLLYTAFFHDIIYDAKKQDNEEQSALYWENFCSKNPKISTLTQQRVSHIIRKTAKHTTPIDLTICTKLSSSNYNHLETTKLFLDFDLSILGGTPKEYKTYSQGIRHEYQHYPEASYKIGRAKVLSNFLKAPCLFQTDYCFEKYEKNARENISQEIKLLQS